MMQKAPFRTNNSTVLTKNQASNFAHGGFAASCGILVYDIHLGVASAVYNHDMPIRWGPLSQILTVLNF